MQEILSFTSDLPFRYLPELLMSGLLGLVFYQDLKERSVSAYLFGLLFILAGIRYYLAGNGYEWLLFNSFFILLQLGVLQLYCLLRFGSANLFYFFGAGDLLLWGVLALLFSPFNFIFFFISSLLASFGLYYFLIRWQQSLHQTVPLAGFQSLLLIFVLGFGQIHPQWHPYEDFSLLNLIGLV